MVTWFLSELACPDCRDDLPFDDDVLHCACGFSTKSEAQLDLRPQNAMPRMIEITPGHPQRDLSNLSLERPAPAYEGPRAQRDSSELFSAAHPYLAPGRRLLDLGCGPRDQSVPAAHLKLDYAGIDFDSKAADLLADGHAIPFRADTFDAVLSYAVLEHLYSPPLALLEVARVLRHGGVFFGAVSQGEPFHDSFFHHTAWAVASSFHDAELELVRLWPSYDTLHSLATMGRYARVMRVLIEAVHRLDRAMPFLAPRKFFRASKREKQLEELYRAASICFVAIKPFSRAIRSAGGIFSISR